MTVWELVTLQSSQSLLQHRPFEDAGNAEDAQQNPPHAGCFIAPLTFQLFWHSFPIGDPNSDYKAPFANVYRGMAVIGTQVIVPGLVSGMRCIHWLQMPLFRGLLSTLIWSVFRHSVYRVSLMLVPP